MEILTEEQTKEIIDGALEQIKSGVIEEATNHAKWITRDAIADEVRNIVTDFVKKKVAPEILVSLEKQKSAIIDAAIMSAQTMAEMLAQSLTDTLAEKLKNSWDRKKIFDAMFGN